MPPIPHYTELHCLTNFSFLHAASHPHELVERAAALGYSGLAITDLCSLAGIVRAHEAAREYGLKLLIGTEIDLTDGPRLVFLATDRDGYGRLSRLITQGRRAADKGDYHLTRADLDQGLPGCLVFLIPRPDESPTDLEAHGHWLAGRFPDRAWLAVELLRGTDDQARLNALCTVAERCGLPPVAAGGVRMHRRGRRALLDALTAIRLGTTVAQAGRALPPNGEAHLRRRETLAGIYPRALLDETQRIAERCTFDLGELTYDHPAELVPEGLTSAEYLRRLTWQGMRQRWPQGVSQSVIEQIEHELDLIEAMGYEGYLLTCHDIVAFARQHDILCQGRGSAANSAVCFCLGITEVDPARTSMLFERFISKERNEPPDIDIDFEHERREEVLQYIYGKYGRERAALAATVITYQPRSAVRDLGKALGLSAGDVDRLAKSLNWWDDAGACFDERLRELGFDPASPTLQRLATLLAELVGFPRHLSQHVGGFVIAHQPLCEVVPIENAAMEDRTVIEWDKDDLDTVGLLKFDCLGLGMLSCIRRAFDLIADYRGIRHTLAEVPPEDPAVYRMIQAADTIGVFQIESRAQMAMLPRLKPACFYDLVIEVAIVRPGPIQGEMVHPYLRRRQGQEPVVYEGPVLKEVLGRTLGVPIFQEQAMQLAIKAAGFSPGEADALRRSMAAWRRHGSLDRFERRLIDGMLERGYDEVFARRVFEQIRGFAGYGFPESHAASFALLVYCSAWLKCHEPAAFACALLNSQPMGFYAPAQIVQDTRRHGVEVRPPDAVHSDWECTLEAGAEGEPALRLGLCLLKGLSQAGGERLVAARARAPFHSVNDLIARAGLDRGDRAALADGGALAALAGHRHRAHWSVHGVETPRPLLAEAPEPAAALRAPSEGEDLLADYASLGLTLGRHPLALLRETLRERRALTAAEILSLPHKRHARAAGLVTLRQRPSTATGVIFVTLEDETGLLNLVVYHRLAQRQRRELLNATVLAADGVIEREGEVCHLICRRLHDYSALAAHLNVSSRDFR